MLLETFKKTDRSSVLIGLILKATKNSNPNLRKGNMRAFGLVSKNSE